MAKDDGCAVVAEDFAVIDEALPPQPYVSGCFGVNVAGNVPLNQELDRMELGRPQSIEGGVPVTVGVIRTR